MIKTRICVGLAVLLATSCPLYVLSHVTYGVRYGMLTQIYQRADISFPTVSTFLWPLGPLDWWSYVTPAALAIGVAARFRTPVRPPILSVIVVFSIVQAALIVAGFLPFAKLGSVMGYPEPAPYPTLPLLINLAMVVASVGFGGWSLARCVAGDRQEIKKGQQDGTSNGG